MTCTSERHNPEIQPFEARIDARNGVASIALSGELDMTGVPILEGHIALFEAAGTEAIVLDLRDLTFMDSSAVHALQHARDRAKANAHRLIVVGADARARRLFDLTGTASLLDGTDTLGVLSRFTGTGTNQPLTLPDMSVDRSA